MRTVIPADAHAAANVRVDVTCRKNKDDSSKLVINLINLKLNLVHPYGIVIGMILCNEIKLNGNNITLNMFGLNN